MGCISCKNQKFIHHHSPVSLVNPHQDNEDSHAPPQLDLTYRNYLSHNQLLPNRPHHFIFKFRPQCIYLNSNINNSTIQMRRIRSVMQNCLKNNELEQRISKKDNK